MNAPPLIDYGRMLDLLGIEGELLMAATREAPPHAQVAGVSGLTVERTLRHVCETFADVAERITEPLACTAAGRASAPAAGRPARARPVERAEPGRDLASRLADLLAEFGTRHADQPCPSWQPDVNNVGFWLRRTLHATTVHRVDVQAATGARPALIDPDLARDGIDEMLHLWFEHHLNAMGVTASSSWSVRIDVDDHRWTTWGDPSWMRARRGGLAGGGQTGPADAVVAGEAASTYLWLWGRLPDRVVRVRGDYDAVAQLWSLLRLATR